jgi:hypothetical protein
MPVTWWSAWKGLPPVIALRGRCAGDRTRVFPACGSRRVPRGATWRGAVRRRSAMLPRDRRVCPHLVRDLRVPKGFAPKSGPTTTRTTRPRRGPDRPSVRHRVDCARSYLHDCRSCFRTEGYCYERGRLRCEESNRAVDETRPGGRCIMSRSRRTRSEPTVGMRVTTRLSRVGGLGRVVGLDRRRADVVGGEGL